jgi:hypothetical protein
VRSHFAALLLNGLRDYGTGTWEGGEEGCDHKGAPKRTQAGFNERYFGRESIKSDKQGELCEVYRATCGTCGARRVDSQIGLEDTPAAWIARLVEVFAEVRRVLRDDGTLWLNVGDSYAGSWGNYGGQNRGKGGQRAITVGSLPTRPGTAARRSGPRRRGPSPASSPKTSSACPGNWPWPCATTAGICAAR